ncbi:MAG: C40 family peptidase [Cyanobacteria bacterium J06633_2]
MSKLRHLIAENPDIEFRCCTDLNLYDSPQLNSLATQAAAGRQLRVTAVTSTSGDEHSIPVTLCEDDYPGWIAVDDLSSLEKAEVTYHSIPVNGTDICDRLPRVIRYVHGAMERPNHYLWGGTIGPNYDCSGLMQAAFVSVGVWIPRDAYQQHAFTQPISLEEAAPGDLVFFGNEQRITHVGLYLGDRRYIHSSGKEIGRNGIGIDELSDAAGQVSQAYLKQFKGIGRVTRAYVHDDN